MDQEQAERETFDKAITRRLSRACHEAMSIHPEIRSVGVVVDYFGDLNDAASGALIWIGEKGTVKSPAEIFGSIEQTAKLLEFQVSLARKLRNDLMQEVKDLMQKLGRLDEESKSQGPAGERGGRPPAPAPG